MSLLRIIFCLIDTALLARGINLFMHWWENRPIVEEKEHPFYITRVNKET